MSLEDILTKFLKYNEPLSVKPTYIKYISDFIKKPKSYIEIPFSEQVFPLNLIYHLSQEGYECVIDEVKIPFNFKTYKLRCEENVQFYLFFLQKKSFIIDPDTKNILNERLTKLKEHITGEKFYLDEQITEGFSYIIGPEPLYMGSISNIMKRFFKQPWNNETLVICGVPVSVYIKKWDLFSWVIIPIDEIEKYAEITITKNTINAKR